MQGALVSRAVRAHPDAGRAARGLLRAELGGLLHDRALDAALLVVTEMLSAVIDARRDAGRLIRLQVAPPGDAFTVRVHDGLMDRQALARSQRDRLRIIDLLAEDWGFDEAPAPGLWAVLRPGAAVR